MKTFKTFVGKKIYFKNLKAVLKNRNYSREILEKLGGSQSDASS